MLSRQLHQLHASPALGFCCVPRAARPAATRQQRQHSATVVQHSGVREQRLQCSSSSSSSGVPQPDEDETSAAPSRDTQLGFGGAHAEGSPSAQQPEVAAAGSSSFTPTPHPEMVGEDLSSGIGSSSASSTGAAPAPHPETTEEAVQAAANSSGLVPDSLPLIGSDTDWREFRARLATQQRDAEGEHWAHPIPKPERGALLLANPLLFIDSQEYFYQSVILLLSHNESGSCGIILNRPSQYTLGELQLGKLKDQSQLSLTDEYGEFDDCRLFLGGECGGGQAIVIHAVDGVDDAVEVVRGIFRDGVDSLRQKVADGEIKPEQCRWFGGYASWGPGQLQRECKEWAWFAAAASPDLVLQLPKESDGRDYWHTVLQAMGGNYKQLSESIRNAEL